MKRLLALCALAATPLLFSLGGCSVHVDDRPAGYYHHHGGYGSYGRFYRDDRPHGHYDVIIRANGRRDRVFVRDVD